MARVRILRPGEVTSSGTLVWHGWLVQLRPRVLGVARLFPELVSVAITLRAFLLGAVSLPATSFMFLAAITLEGHFPKLVLAFEAVLWVLSVQGVLGLVWVLFALRFFSWVAARSSKGSIWALPGQIPWGLVTALGTFTLVLWPIVTSAYGFLVPIVWAVEMALGTVPALIPIRKWRQGWAFRRRWPLVWTMIDSTTADPQASWGGGISAFFSQTRAIPRPIWNHPALSWFMDWGIPGAVMFYVYSPNGTVLAQLQNKHEVIAEQFAFVTSVDIQPIRPGSSWGTMTVRFTHDDSVLQGMETDIAAIMGGGQTRRRSR